MGYDFNSFLMSSLAIDITPTNLVKRIRKTYINAELGKLLKLFLVS